jgi:hypothetical protein
MHANASADQRIRLYCLGYSPDADVPSDAREAHRADMAHAEASPDRDPEAPLDRDPDAALPLDGLLLRIDAAPNADES